MNGDRIVFAGAEMRDALLDIWQVCFEEHPEPVSYFFDTYFEPQNCLVYEVNGEAVAMTHLLPAQIVYNKSLVQAHYIYAAATSPKHRSKGYMSTLLTHAAQVGADRGDKYSFLLPSQSELYLYYGRLGYVPYFQTRFVEFSRDALQALAADKPERGIALSHQQVEAVRSRHLRAVDGSVLWGEKAISYAIGISKLYGGQLLCSQAGDHHAYALCSVADGGNCTIVELMADEGTIANLLSTILQYVPAKQYTFRMPGFNNLFAEQGKVLTHGMIKPLVNNAPLDISNLTSLPYLGLTLD